MSKTFNVGIIGAGRRSLDIIKGILAVEDAEVTAIAEPFEESLKNAMPLLPNTPKIFSDYHELLKLKELDGIIVATPNDTHVELALDVLRAGKPLYLEKPMATTAADCDKIIKCAEETKIPMMIGMQLRYSDVYMKMKKLCDSGLIGDVKLIFFRALRNSFQPGVAGWRMKKQCSGGMILEVSVHQLDLFNWFAGSSYSKIAAFGGKNVIYQEQELLDNALMLVEYENGVKANLQAAVFAPQGADPVGLCIVGESGTMYHTDKDIIVKLQENKDIITYSTSGYSRMDENAMRGFKEMITLGKAPLTSYHAGRDAVELGIMAERAIESNSIIMR